MTKIQNIADEHHVIRYLPTRVQIRDFNTGQLTGIFATAFEPRDCDNGALSVTWEEYFQTPPALIEQAIAAFRAAWGKALSRPLFARAQVDAIKLACKASGKPVRVVHQPSHKNPAHSTVRRLKDSEAVVFDQLAQDVFADIRDENGNPISPTPAMGVAAP